MTIRTQQNQRGMVSIMIASILVVIMALITIGFTRVVSNEQRQAIDRQLSEQAFYAAESGINAAIKSTGFPPATIKDDCDVSAYDNGEVSADNDVTFTCVRINPTPQDLVFSNDSITTNRAKVVPIITNPRASELTIQWYDASHNVSGTCSNAPTLPTVENWNNVAPIKMDLIGIPSGSFGREDLVNSQFSAILFPCVGGSGVTSIAFANASGDDDLGRIVPVRCDSTQDYECSLTITGINPGGTTYQQHYIRFNSLYSNVNVRITADDNVVGNTLLFAEAQAIVDSTGRAVDVLRRIQARVPLYEEYITPNGTLQTVDNICKLYDVQASSVVDNCN